ncbi:Protein ARRD-16 a [Aphelenchoides avenae]|nr:Protein ARRD-16 a [Aphelenchus avenae]
MNAFEIRLKSPSAMYASGDEVEGFVFVPENKLANANSVVLQATGIERVKWTDATLVKAKSWTGDTCSSVEWITYKAKQKYLDLNLVLWSRTEKQANDGPLRQIPFTFGTHGSIRYFCEATIERKGGLFKSVKKTSAVFTVRPASFISYHRIRRQELVTINEENASKNGHISSSMTFPRGEFIGGEHVPLTLIVSNFSRRDVARVELMLIERVEFVAFSNARARLDPHGHFTGRRIKEELTTLATFHQPLWVPSKSVGEHQVPFIVPDCSKSFKSAYIRLRHHVKVVLVTSTGKRVIGEVPLFIGSAPLNPVPTNEDPPPPYTEKGSYRYDIAL